MRGWKESAAGDALSCGCNVENGLSRKSEKEAIVLKVESDVLFCSFREEEGFSAW